MSLSQVRPYFRARIAEVEPNLQEWLEPFNLENIPESRIEEVYHIAMSSVLTVPRDDQHLEDNFSVTVSLFSKGFRDLGQDKHDALLNRADCIRQNMCQTFKVAQTDNIRSIQPAGVTLVPQDVSNDNIIRVEIVFNVRTFFKLTDFSLQ